MKSSSDEKDTPVIEADKDKFAHLEQKIQELEQQLEHIRATRAPRCPSCRGTGILDYGYGERYPCGCS